MIRINRFKKFVATVMIAALTVGSSIACPSAYTETVFAANDIAINETNFDAVICAYLSEKYDTDSDGYIDDVSQVKRISTGSSSNQVQSLEGIEKLTALESLYISNGAFTEIDLRQNTNLTSVTMYQCSDLASVNVTGLTALEDLEFQFSYKVTSVQGLNTLTALTYFRLEGTEITEFDFSSNTNLEYISVSSNDLTSLNVAGLSNLETLYCGRNYLTELNLTGCTALTYLSCGNNSWSSVEPLDLSLTPNLVELHIDGPMNDDTRTMIERLAFPVGNKLEVLSVNNNNFTSLNVTNCTELKRLNCNDNPIETLVLNNPKLETLSYTLLYADPDESKAFALDTSDCPALTSVTLSRNYMIKEMDFSNNPLLKSLDIDSTSVTSLDVTNNPALYNLDVDGLDITSLDLSRNTELLYLNVADCDLTSLDLSNNTKLKNLTMGGCAVRNLSLRNLNNLERVVANYSYGPDENNLLESIDFTGCTALTYVELEHIENLHHVDLSDSTLLGELEIDLGKVLMCTLPSSNTTLNLDAAADRQYAVAVSDVEETFDLKTLVPDIDGTKISNVAGNKDASTVSINGTVLSGYQVYETISYQYDCGNGMYITGKVYISSLAKATNSWTKPLTIEGWTYSSDNSTAKEPTATAAYGTPVFTYSTSEDGSYTSTKPSDAGTYWVKATVAETTDYSGLEAKVSFKINQATPAYTVPDNLTAKAGQTLSAVTLPSGFSWMDATTTSVGAVGTNTFKVKYTPVDTKNYKTVENINVSIVVSLNTNEWTRELAMSSWIYGETASVPTATSKYGTPVFTYSTSVDGTYTDAKPSDAGTYYVKATVAATDVYTGLESLPAEFKINQATPTYTVPRGLKANVGQTLSDVTLPSGFSWMDAGTTSVGAVGTNTFKVKYTPTDTKNYKTVENINVSVAVGLNTNEWTAELTISGWTYGKDASVPVAASKYGTPVFTYSDSADGTYTDVVPTNAGTYYVKATVAATNVYTGLESTPVSFKINKATPEYTVPDGLKANVGQTLSDVTLPEGFSWMDAETTSVGAKGSNTFKVKYTPTDLNNYVVVENINVSIAVGINANEWTSDLAISDWAYGKKASVPTATSKYGTPVFTYSTSADGTYTDEVPTNAGTYYVKATVDATDVYAGLESAPVEFKINKATPTYTVPSGLTAKAGQKLSDVELPSGFSFMDADTTSVGTAGTNTFKVKYTPEDTKNYVAVENIEVSIVVDLNTNEWTAELTMGSWTFGNEASVPVASSKYGNDTIKYTYSTTADGTYTDAKPTDAGTYYVKATVAETNLYTGLESAPVEFKINKAIPTYTVPGGLTAYVDQTLADVELPSGFSWMDDASTSVGAVGTNTFKVKYTPADTKNYVEVENIEVLVEVSEQEEPSEEPTDEPVVTVDAPNTGDNSMVMLWMAMLLISLMGMVMTLNSKNNDIEAE